MTDCNASPARMTALPLPARLLSLAGVAAVVGLMFCPVSTGFCGADVALPLVAATLAVLGALLLLACRRPFHLTSIDLLLGLWLLYVLLRAWCTPDVPCLPAVLRALSLAALYAALRLLCSCALPTVPVMEGAVSLFALLQALLCLAQVVTGSSRHAAFPITGTFLNPGPCSAALLMGLCLGVYRFFFPIPSASARLSHASSTLSIVTLVLCSLLLPLGWSRAALLSLACCLVVATWRRMRPRVRLLVMLGVLVAVALLYLLKRGSADGRVLFYAISSSAVVRHPMAGSGIGSFFLTYARETASLHTHLPMTLASHASTLDYALCDGLRLAVEQGLLGLSLAILSLFTVLFHLRRRSPALALALLGLAFFSLCSYPFQLLPFQLLAVLLAAWAATRPAGGAWETRDRGPVRGRMCAVVVCAVAVVSALLTVRPAHERVLATRQSRLIVGRDHPRMLVHYQRLLPYMRHDAQFLFRYGQLLASCGRYNESDYVLGQGVLVSNDAMFHVLRGHNYRHLHAWPQACAAYRQAHAQSPSRLYPLLCLMRLYRQMGRRDQAVRTARMLLRLPVEHDSALAREIRDEAKNCILEQ